MTYERSFFGVQMLKVVFFEYYMLGVQNPVTVSKSIYFDEVNPISLHDALWTSVLAGPKLYGH